MGATRFVFTGLVFLLVQKASGQNCTALYNVCKPLGPGRTDSRSGSSVDIDPCSSEPHEELCTSYKSFWLCVNNTMANCLNDQVISKELFALRQAWGGYCSQEKLCGSKIGKCHCEAVLVSGFPNVTKMCNNQANFRECIGKITDCEQAVPVQQAKLFITMTEAICRTACPESFRCFMSTERQSPSLFQSSGTPGVRGSICSDVMPRFQCLSNTSRTCSASISDKWQRVVTSYDEVCSVFDEYMTDPSPCEKIQTCVNKAEAVPGVTLGDWRNNVTVFLTHTKEVMTGMLNPGTWCSILTHAVGCVDQLADICNVTMKEKLASMKISVGNNCKDTDVSNESGRPTSGFERLSSFPVVSFLMGAIALLKV